MLFLRLFPFLASGFLSAYFMHEGMPVNGGIPVISALIPGALFGFALLLAIADKGQISFSNAIYWVVYSTVLHWLFFLLAMISSGLIILLGPAISMFSTLVIGRGLNQFIRDTVDLPTAGTMRVIGILAGILGFGLILIGNEASLAAGFYCLYLIWQLGMGAVLVAGTHHLPEINKNMVGNNR